jgi:hypothetical protein
MEFLERRVIGDRFAAHVSDETAAALRRCGGPCEACHIGPPVRRAEFVANGVARCADCERERRLGRIAARIHR